MKHLTLMLAITAAVLSGCKDEKKPAEATQTSAPVASETAPAANAATASPAGTFKGILPCASCEGTETTIVLKDDGSYSLTTLFLGEPDAKPQTVSGKFRLSDDKAFVHLDEAGFNYVYFLDGDTLEMRNSDGTTGERTAEENAAYRLQKQ